MKTYVGTSLIPQWCEWLLNQIRIFQTRKNVSLILLCYSHCNGYRQDVLLSWICFINIFSNTFLSLGNQKNKSSPDRSTQSRCWKDSRTINLLSSWIWYKITKGGEAYSKLNLQSILCQIKAHTVCFSTSRNTSFGHQLFSYCHFP